MNLELTWSDPGVVSMVAAKCGVQSPGVAGERMIHVPGFSNLGLCCVWWLSGIGMDG